MFPVQWPLMTGTFCHALVLLSNSFLGFTHPFLRGYAECDLLTVERLLWSNYWW